MSLSSGLSTGLPTGLAWRPEFAPQHVEGAEKPSATSTSGGNQATEAGAANSTAGTGTGTETGAAQGNKAGAPQNPCGDSSMLWMMGAMFVVLYFFMIRPNQKQEKTLKEMRSNLLAGDKVVTSSGLHGQILSVDEKAQTVTLKTDDEGRVRMTFDQSAVSRKVTDDSEAAKT